MSRGSAQSDLHLNRVTLAILSREIQLGIVAEAGKDMRGAGLGGKHLESILSLRCPLGMLREWEGK